jgi:hypothetical protein
MIRLVTLAFALSLARVANGEPPQVLARLDHQIPHDLCSDGNAVYWTDRRGGAVWKVATLGGGPMTVMRAPLPVTDR